MRFRQILKLRFRSLFRRSAVEDEARREIEVHLEQLIRERIADGISPADARARALREMGNLGQFQDQSRDHRRVRYLLDLADDLSFAVRLLRKSPAFTVVSVLSLALGIGANTAIFTLIKRSYLEMLPVRNPEEIIRLSLSTIAQDSDSFTYPLYRDISGAAAPFDGLLCTASGRTSFAADDGVATESIHVQLVSGNFYQLLGVQPLIGRLLTPDDDRRPGAHPVLVLSHNYWRRRFGGDPSVVGKTVRVNTTPMTIIGVSPPRFDGLSQGWSPDAVAPMMMTGAVHLSEPPFERRGHWWIEIDGRLKANATARQAELALQPVVEAYYAERAQQPDTSDYARRVYASNRIKVRPMARGWNREPKAAAASMALFGITAVVLLAACANLANLLLARAAARRHEIEVRMALGAGRLRLMRQLFTESLLLAALGGGLGLVLSVAAGPAVLRLALGDDPHITQSSAPDATILLFCLGIATCCGMLFGLAPIWHALHRRPGAGFGGGGRTVAGTRLLGRKLLLSTQIALTLILLTGAGLFARTMRNMRTADLGFAPEHLIQMNLMPRNAGYTSAKALPFFDRVLDSIRAVPGVATAAVAAMPVMANYSWGSGIRIEGVTVPDNQRGPDRNAVGPAYFSTLGIPILLGREFEQRDAEGAPAVAIVNEAFVRIYFGGQNPIGRRIDTAGSTAPPRYTIVGVAKDGKYRNVRDRPTAFWYVPVAQSDMRNLMLYVRTAGEPSHTVGEVRRAVAAVDGNVATFNLRTMESQIAQQQRLERMIAMLSVFFGGLAAILAAIGLYGVLSYLVSQRQREIGVRIALGATPYDVIRMVVASVASWAVSGILLALPAIYYGSNAVRDILFEIVPMDRTALLWAGASLAAVACIAAWLPARRAASIAPSTALRAD